MSEHEHNELPESRVDFPGPFTHHDVVVSGWKVPLLQAQISDDESRVMLVLDDRFALDLTVEEAERVVPFLADAMAVALGYDAHPTDSDDPPLRRAPHPKPHRTLSIAQWGDD